MRTSRQGSPAHQQGSGSMSPPPTITSPPAARLTMVFQNTCGTPHPCRPCPYPCRPCPGKLMHTPWNAHPLECLYPLRPASNAHFSLARFHFALAALQFSQLHHFESRPVPPDEQAHHGIDDEHAHPATMASMMSRPTLPPWHGGRRSSWDGTQVHPGMWPPRHDHDPVMTMTLWGY